MTKDEADREVLAYFEACHQADRHRRIDDLAKTALTDNWSLCILHRKAILGDSLAQHAISESPELQRLLTRQVVPVER